MMDPAAFESKLKYGQPFDSKYAGKLEKLLGNEQFEEFWELIALMLDKKLKIEQEAFLL